MKNILIYGAAGGIGREICKQLHGQGCSLHLVGRDENRLHDLAEELEATFSVGDVMQGQTFDQVMQDCQPSLDGLVYSVGTINLSPFSRLTAEDYLRDFQINAVGAAMAIRAALPALKKSDQTSSVVLYSSVAAQSGFSLHASIGMAKAAVEGLVRSLAAELSPKIRVNAIAPSLTQTPLAGKVIANDQMAQKIACMHPLKRLGTPQDIAGMTTFLLSEKADWITGQIFAVDGGRSTLD